MQQMNFYAKREHPQREEKIAEEQQQFSQSILTNERIDFLYEEEATIYLDQMLQRETRKQEEFTAR